MKVRSEIITILVCCLSMLISCSEKKGERDSSTGSGSLNNEILNEVSFDKIEITDGFWRPKIDSNRINGIRNVFKECSYSLDNFDIAAGKKDGEHKGTAASDSDVYKIIQGAAYALYHDQDEELEAFIDSLIQSIVDAQQDDGYLFTYWTINDPSMRWKDIERKHELYCAGHMFEAAVAYYQVTGKRVLLDAAIKLADHIDSLFGEGKTNDVPGHQEIELALFKLYNTTGEKRYLDLSMFFVGERGNPDRVSDLMTPPEFDPNAGKPSRWRHPSYRQDHLPVEEQYYAVGHAVRAAYLYSAMGDLASADPSLNYMPALDSIWTDIVTKKLYITGAIGTRQFHDEGFGTEYLLPNDKAYCETCSGIALTFWNRRMNILTADSKYADMLELTMYNGGISGVSLEGDRFFYTNPLESTGRNRRSPWFEPGCCPSNMVRFLPEIGSNIYAKGKSSIYLNQFIASKASISLEGNTVDITMSTDYPWSGDVELALEPEKPGKFEFNIRIPGWTRGQLVYGDLYSYLKDPSGIVSLTVNGKDHKVSDLTNGYVSIEREWNKGDVVKLSLPMDVGFVKGNTRISDADGKVVLSRGPVMYCLEEVDNPEYFDENNEAFVLPQGVKAEYQSDMLGGIVTLKAWASLLTREEEIELRAVPYYAWCNRGSNQMKVWLPLMQQ